MQDKILNVFYAEDRLPYKDASRTTHYPIVNGNVFNGANNVTKIRYYLDRIGGFANVTWVVVSKLPNGQIANELLNSNNAVLDSELGEYYIEFEISSYYTSIQGDVYLSLNGYQGGVEVEQDEDTGVYSIYGTPTIQATGSIKIGVNYAPQTIPGSHFNTSDLQQVLGLISDKANISDTILVVDELPSDVSGYNEGQVFYDKETSTFYILDDSSLEKYDIGYQQAISLDTKNLIDLVEEPSGWVIGRYNGNLHFVKVVLSPIPSLHYEYAIYQLTTTGTINAWINNNASASTIASILSSTPTYEFATKEYLSSNYYNRTETENKIDSAIADFLQKEYELVDTTTYPTLNDFLASTGQEGYIYLYPIDTTDLTKGYYQYIWENNAWLSLGTTQIDLSGYVPTNRTIAGVDLADNITAQELTDSLVLTNTTTDVSYILGD